ncbi:phage antirepressor KilAC domain-containing protein [Burkholderia anthina]|nr:phage antirepressor KilAC domain-containing protein [Burkholderia anthina]
MQTKKMADPQASQDKKNLNSNANVNTQLLGAADQLTMSSREIADLVDSRHDDVKRSIARLADRGVIQLPPMAEVKNHLGQTVAEYRVGKRDSYVIVAQLSPEFTARLVDRWQELEARTSAVAFTIPQNLPDALRLAADLADERDQLKAEVQLAAPKAKALDRLSAADGSLCITDAAKSLKVQPKALFRWLSLHDWIYRRGVAWVAHQVALDRGMMEHRVTTIHRDDGTEKATTQARVTAKGLTVLATKLGEGRAA